ncbi:MAG TPA: metallophosphoesterase [Polyangiales bacterium]|nr:metallophosphoesterase [Polyangiales bacterium]
MRRPLLIGTCLSLVLHGYIGWSLLPALVLGPAGLSLALALLLVSALLTPAPLLIRLAHLPERAADLLAWAGYLAMGVFSSVLVLCLLRDMLLAALWLWNAVHPASMDLDALRQLSALTVIGLSGAMSAIGVVNARSLAAVVNVDVPITDLPRALDGFTIVQLSDIHVGPTIKRGYLNGIVNRVNGLNADLVTITGDVIDGPVERLRPHVEPLADLRSRHGTYCVTGNHEYYHGVDAWVHEWRRLGLNVLLNENSVLNHEGECLLIGGVTDYGAHHYHAAHRSDPTAAARTATPVALKVLLAHQPRTAAVAADAGFDLQLSGHTHGGQFLPWNWFVPLQQPFVAGLKRFQTLWVYTSRGTGYWGPPLRFFAPSEITRLRLVRSIVS